MEEKDMVSDILSGVKSSLGSYAKVITECSDENLRKTFQQMRDGDETFQFDLYKMASEKGYYKPACSADSSETSTLKSELAQAVSR